MITYGGRPRLPGQAKLGNLPLPASCPPSGKLRDGCRVAALLHRNVRYLQFRILVVPLRRDALKCEPEWLALARSERGYVQIYRVRIRSTGLKHMERDNFRLRHLAHGILEGDVDHHVSEGFVTGIGDRAVDVGHRRAYKEL